MGKPAASDTPELPLHRSWDVWVDRASTQPGSWSPPVHAFTFQSVQTFWGFYNNTPKLREFQHCGIYLFKSGIGPTWEHDKNKHGGKLVLNISRDRHENGSVDDIWLDTLLLLIGETWDHDDVVTGVSIHVRKGGDRFGIWTRTGAEAPVRALMNNLYEQIPAMTEAAEFKLHAESIGKNSCFSAAPQFRVCPVGAPAAVADGRAIRRGGNERTALTADRWFRGAGARVADVIHPNAEVQRA